jgi:glutamate formiminotransferase/formiminotetrahydrofolate cyclodeaminase
MVDEDTNAFNKIMEAFDFPKKTDEEKMARTQAIQEATLYATQVPLKVMHLCYESMEVMKAMAEFGNPNSVTDAGVGALAAMAGVRGAMLNVRINASGLNDKELADRLLSEAKNIENRAAFVEKEVLSVVESKL